MLLRCDGISRPHVPSQFHYKEIKTSKGANNKECQELHS